MNNPDNIKASTDRSNSDHKDSVKQIKKKVLKIIHNHEVNN